MGALQKDKAFQLTLKLCARLGFAQYATNWTRERLDLQIFSDEVRAKGGAHTGHVFLWRQGSGQFRDDPTVMKERHL